jgi:tRNA pseudouridine38-40 synthase
LPRTIKLTVAYDGTRYVGWQRQADGVSIQGLLEDALARFEGGAVTVHGAGRTDAGVHALGQVASAKLSTSHETAGLFRGLNAALPPDVRVIQVEDVADDFHARFSARSKTYRYVVRNAPVVSPFEYQFVWHIPEKLDVRAMQAAAALLVGTHDCACFRSVGNEMKDTTRTITRSDVALVEPGLVRYEVDATGFLRHMVRAITGTLVEVGRGSRTPESIPSLQAGRRRADAGATAPPQGLFLVTVKYD